MNQNLTSNIDINYHYDIMAMMTEMTCEPIFPDAFSAGLLKRKSYPCVDGHFWLVRNGKIIDPYFDDYTFVKKVQGCNNKQVYLPASPLVQTILKRKFAEVDESWGVTKQFIIDDFNGKPLSGRCYHNARMLMEDGDELVFGSMGWHKKTGGIHYEFGGEDWTVKQFLK